MIITFFGHSKLYSEESVTERIYEILENEVGEKPAEFYLGGYGTFDSYALRACEKFRKTHGGVRLFFITPYLDNIYLKNKEFITQTCDEVIFPPIEKVLKPYAILARNKWMAKQADLVIAYLDCYAGGAGKAVEYALLAKKRVINLGAYRGF